MNQAFNCWQCFNAQNTPKSCFMCKFKPNFIRSDQIAFNITLQQYFVNRLYIKWKRKNSQIHFAWQILFFWNEPNTSSLEHFLHKVMMALWWFWELFSTLKLFTSCSCRLRLIYVNCPPIAAVFVSFTSHRAHLICTVRCTFCFVNFDFHKLLVFNSAFKCCILNWKILHRRNKMLDLIEREWVFNMWMNPM